MDGVSVLRDRVVALNSGLHALVDEVAGVDWSVAVLPGTSPIGLTLWHLPRAQDWVVNTCIRDVAEVADTTEHDGLPDPDEYGFGTGLSEAQVRAAAAQVTAEPLLRYADAVRRSVEAWLDGITDADLDEVVGAFDERQSRRPAYSTPAARAEVSQLGGRSVGVLLLRPAISHVLLHMGEVELLGQLARRG